MPFLIEDNIPNTMSAKLMAPKYHISVVFKIRQLFSSELLAGSIEIKMPEFRHRGYDKRRNYWLT